MKFVEGSTIIVVDVIFLTDDCSWFWAGHAVKCCCRLSAEYCHQKVSYL